MTRIEVAFARGWYRLVGRGDAHYVEVQGTTLCGTGAREVGSEGIELGRWTVPEHCGAIPLCDDCREAIRRATSPDVVHQDAPEDPR